VFQTEVFDLRRRSVAERVGTMIIAFNSTASALTMQVNRGQVQAPDRMVPENGFRPFSRSYRLEKFAGESIFGIGANVVDLRFRDFQPPLATSASFAPTIPDGSIRSDYILFIFANGASLLRSSGEPVEQFDWSGRNLLTRFPIQPGLLTAQRE
jgi:hypothetical protein